MKNLSIIFCTLFLMSLTTMALCQNRVFYRGDINEDLDLTADDVSALSYALENSPGSYTEPFDRYDVDDDGDIDYDDLTYLVMHVYFASNPPRPPRIDERRCFDHKPDWITPGYDINWETRGKLMMKDFAASEGFASSNNWQWFFEEDGAKDSAGWVGRYSDQTYMRPTSMTSYDDGAIGIPEVITTNTINSHDFTPSLLKYDDTEYSMDSYFHLSFFIYIDDLEIKAGMPAGADITQHINELEIDFSEVVVRVVVKGTYSGQTSFTYDGETTPAPTIDVLGGTEKLKLRYQKVFQSGVAKLKDVDTGTIGMSVSKGFPAGSNKKVTLVFHQDDLEAFADAIIGKGFGSGEPCCISGVFLDNIKTKYTQGLFGGTRKSIANNISIKAYINFNADAPTRGQSAWGCTCADPGDDY